MQQGIEYGYVGGDPAELMRLSVENGMFTVSFLKEGLQKVCMSYHFSRPEVDLV
jgi:hypothetical protein